jgi:hypothetical protein
MALAVALDSEAGGEPSIINGGTQKSPEEPAIHPARHPTLAAS